jgi:hypothetical protein
VTLTNPLPLELCPYCRTARPLLAQQWQGNTKDHSGKSHRFWGAYDCKSCGGIVLVSTKNAPTNNVETVLPAIESVSTSIPNPAREYLNQAVASRNAPAGAVMLAASSVDAMLKDRGLLDGSLDKRIKEAEANHLITSEMALWAHEIRLDANAQRHADNADPLPTSEDAERVILFATALAQFLYVLPAMVTRGRATPP